MESQSPNVESAELFSAEFLIDLLMNNHLYLDGKTTDEKSLTEMEQREEKETENLSIPSSDDSNHFTEVRFKYDRDILLQIRQCAASQAKFRLHDYLLGDLLFPFTCLRAVPNTKKPEQVTKPVSNNNKGKRIKFAPQPPKTLAAKVIQYGEPVQLHKSENPWIPVIIMHMKNVGCKGLSNILSSNPNDQAQQISLWKKKKALAILNRITAETFEKFCTQFCSLLKLKLQSNPSIEDDIVDIIVKKTISEEKFCALYVKLLYIMINNQQQPSSIRKRTLDQFQIQFNWTIEEILKLQKVEREISSCRGSTTTTVEYAQEFKLTTEKKMALKSDCLSLMKALGELYRYNLISHGIILKCIWTLLETMHDLGYKSVCSLLTQVGEKLERDLNAKPLLPHYESASSFLTTIWNRLEQVANGHAEISWSTLCATLNVIDFRNKGWKKTTIPEIPTTKPIPLKEVNGVDSNWRVGNAGVPPRFLKKNKKVDKTESEPKVDRNSHAKDDIEGGIVYRRFRPNKSNDKV